MDKLPVLFLHLALYRMSYLECTVIKHGYLNTSQLPEFLPFQHRVFFFSIKGQKINGQKGNKP